MDSNRKNDESSSSRDVPASRREWRRRTWLLVVRHVLKRRYAVELDRAGTLREVCEGPVIVLPNHPAYIDPPLLLSCIDWRLRLRPLVYTDTFRHPMLRSFVKALEAVEVPELRRESRTAARKIVAMMREVKSGLKRGESFLVYPSGRLQRDGTEKLYAARAAYELIRAAPPQTRVVLLRSRGLWGSRFSCYPEGDVPQLGKTMFGSLASLFGNGWWWMPKRRVTISHNLLRAETLQQFSRDELNRWLEAWYDSDGGESATDVPNHFLVSWREKRSDTARKRRGETVKGWRARAALRTRRIRSAARAKLGMKRRKARPPGSDHYGSGQSDNQSAK